MDVHGLKGSEKICKQEFGVCVCVFCPLKNEIVTSTIVGNGRESLWAKMGRTEIGKNFMSSPVATSGVFKGWFLRGGGSQ